MTDPFSIIVGTASLIDVCWRFGSYLHDIQAGAAKIDDEIETLSRDIEALRVINETIRDSCENLPGYLSSEIESSKHMETFWRNVSSNLASCRLIVEDLEVLVEGIMGTEPPKNESKIMKKFGGFRKQLRKQSREGEFDKLQNRLSTYYNAIQLMLKMIIW